MFHTTYCIVRQEYIRYPVLFHKQVLSFVYFPHSSIHTLDELYRMLYETLDKLPENYRTVFMKSFFEGKTHVEIAEEMNLSVKSINRYKQKTMELLRNELKDYLPLLLLLIYRT